MFAFLLVIACAFSSSALANNFTTWREDGASVGELQLQIVSLKPGDTLDLARGEYQGPIIIRTPGITVRGQGDARITGSGKGTVVLVEADDVHLEGLIISGSGQSHDQVDAGIAIRNGKGVTVKDVKIEDCLFGIDIANAHNVSIEKSRISSKGLPLGLRGDAIRLWSSKDIVIKENYWSDTRDTVSWYSERVHFLNNEATRSRYSIHSMYSKRLMIRGNQFRNNSVGIFIMYGEGTMVLDNVVSDSVGATGLCLGMKETSGLYARGNKFLYCAAGILVDHSPWEPSSKDWFQENTLAFNNVGVLFSDARPGNLFEKNRFISNLLDVDSESRQPSRSEWVENSWDAYDGFDRDRDGIGDTPYRILKYSDLLSGAHPMARFFHGSPVATLIGIVERMLPLTEPTELIVDPKPRLERGH